MSSKTFAARGSSPATSLRRSWPIVFCILFLALQLTLPVVKLAQDFRPGRWGWQMYSGYGANSVEYWVVTSAGDLRKVSPKEYLVTYRGDLPMERYLPAHICRTTDVREVRHSIEGGPLETLPCE